MTRGRFHAGMVSTPVPASASVPVEALAETAALEHTFHSSAALHRRLWRARSRLYRLVDVLLLVLAAIAATVAAPGPADVGELAWAGAYVLVTLAGLEARRFYNFRLHDTPTYMLAQVFVTTSVAAMAVTFLRATTSDSSDVATEIVRLWVFALVFLGAGRLGITLDQRRALRHGEAGLSTLIVGAGTVGQLIARRLLDHPEYGLRPTGFLDKDPLIDASGESAIPVLGASWDLERVVREHGIEQVLFAFSMAPHSVLLTMMRACRRLGVEVAVVPRLFEEVSNRIEIEHVGAVPLLKIATVDPRGWQFTVKYAIDRVAAALAVIVLSPPLAALALIVRLSSPGPILYRQQRVGLDGKVFHILKFRTMRLADPAETFTPAEGVAPGGVEGVDRRTRAGVIMRRLSLDELPQLFNILRGEMSFIGPRPERCGFVEAFEKRVYRYGDRHRVKSGLTGWAQVHGLRGQTSLADRVEWDNYYIENWSPWLDLEILLLTVPAVLGRKGA
ncbi:MAG TPA: sugar transferase [Solirubrobacteraceae bacterium]|nr:sugar transferase [Solirubrobacteraceae bacterium]